MKTFLQSAFLLAVLAGSLSACSGRNLHTELDGKNLGVLRRQWTINTRSDLASTNRAVDFSGAVLWENTLIFGSSGQGLVSIYPGMSLRRWRLPIKDGIVSEITEDKGNLYFGASDGFLYSVSAETGRVNWRYELRNPQMSRPTIVGGRLFVTTNDDTVHAFDAGTGEWIWHYRRRSAATATIRGASQPLVDAGEVLVGLSDGFLVALTVEDGQLKWERKLHQGTRFTDVDAHPVLDAGVLYVPSYDGALYALKRQNGEVLWRFDAGGSRQVTLEGDHIFLPSSDGNLYCLQKANAKVLWKFEFDGGVPTQIRLTDKYLLVGSSHQYLYAIDKNTGRGVDRFNAGFESGFYGAPAYDAAKKRLYALSARGNLYAFDVK